MDIFEPFRDLTNPLILQNSSNSAVNIFKGIHKGHEFKLALDAEVAFSPFEEGVKLSKLNTNLVEVASDERTSMEKMTFSDGSEVAVDGDIAIILSNEEIYSPFTGNKVFVEFASDDMDEDDSSDNLIEDVEDDSEGSDDSNESDESDGSDSMDEESENVSEDEEPEAESDDSNESMDEMTDDSNSEEDTEDSNESEENEEDTEDNSDSEEVTVEAASFALTSNHRFIAMDEMANEIAVFADGNLHIGTLSKNKAHEDKRSLFTNAKLISTAFNNAFETASAKDLTDLGYSPVEFKVNLPTLTKAAIEQIKEEAVKANAETASANNDKLRESIKLAIMAIAKGATKSSVIDTLANPFETAGFNSASYIISSTLEKNAEEFARLIYETASSLSSKSEDYLEALADTIAKASFVPSVTAKTEVASMPSTVFHMPTFSAPKDNKETAKPKKVRVFN